MKRGAERDTPDPRAQGMELSPHTLGRSGDKTHATIINRGQYVGVMPSQLVKVFKAQETAERERAAIVVMDEAPAALPPTPATSAEVDRKVADEKQNLHQHRRSKAVTEKKSDPSQGQSRRHRDKKSKRSDQSSSSSGYRRSAAEDHTSLNTQVLATSRPAAAGSETREYVAKGGGRRQPLLENTGQPTASGRKGYGSGDGRKLPKAVSAKKPADDHQIDMFEVRDDQRFDFVGPSCCATLRLKLCNGLFTCSSSIGRGFLRSVGFFAGNANRRMLMGGLSLLILATDAVFYIGQSIPEMSKDQGNPAVLKAMLGAAISSGTILSLDVLSQICKNCDISLAYETLEAESCKEYLFPRLKFS